MTTLENLILQWVNCLLDTNNCIKTVEDLEDYKVLYKLIDKVKLWNFKDYEVNCKEVIIKFLNDEYPYFIISKKTDTVENLYITLLILSRLSLEPIFHKSLCNLQLEMQIKIKSILETIYSLGKKVTAEDLHKIFSLSDSNDIKPSFKKPRHVLEEFLTSPITRSVHSDNKIFEQLKQIRHLRAELETARYEKSELVEDIKNQEKQINELQCKLQETLLELKALRAGSFKSKDSNCSIEEQNMKAMNSTYEKEIKSLEKYVAQLENDNYQLQDEKNDLINEMKTYKTKLCELEEKFFNNEQILESLTLQLEKKDEELTELKLRHDEMCLYLKESTKTLNNQSFDIDDSKSISEMSIIKSEPLSSVIEIQLEETKKEILSIYNKFRYMDTVTTMILEEYIKLKNKVNILSRKINDKHIVNKIKEETQNYNVIHIQDNISQEELNNFIQKQYTVTELNNNCSFIVRDEIKTAFIQILWNDLKNLSERSLFLDVLGKAECRNPKKSKNNIEIKSQKTTNTFNDSTLLSTSKALQTYQGSKSINEIKGNELNLNFVKILSQSNWTNQLMCAFKGLFESFDIKTEVNSKTDRNDKLIVNYKNTFLIQKEITHITQIICNTIFSNSTIECLKSTQIDNGIFLFSRDDLELLQVTWNSLRESIFNSFKICKVLLFLEKSWSFTVELLKNITCDKFYLQKEFRQLIEKKDVIQNEMKDIYNKNGQFLSLNLITAVEFVTILNKNCNNKIDSNNEKLEVIEDLNNLSLLTGFNLKDNEYNLQQQNYIRNKIIDVQKQMIDFHNLINLYESKQSSDDVPDNASQIQIKTEMIDVEYQVYNESLKLEDENSSVLSKINQDDEACVNNFYGNQIKIEMKDMECQVHNESLGLEIQMKDMECQVRNENLEPETEMTAVECQVHNESLEPETEMKAVECQVHNESLEPKTEMKSIECQVHNESLEPETEMKDMECQVHNESLEPEIEMKDMECQVHNESLAPKTEMNDMECQVHNESLVPEMEMRHVECQVHNESLEPETEMKDMECQVHNESLEPKVEMKDMECQVHNESLEPKIEMKDMECQVHNESLVPEPEMRHVECQVHNESLIPETEMKTVECQVHNESLAPETEKKAVECQVHNESLEPRDENIPNLSKTNQGDKTNIETGVQDKILGTKVAEVQKDSKLKNEKLHYKREPVEIQSTESKVQLETPPQKDEKSQSQDRTKPSIDDLNVQFQKNLTEVHEKYELKLEKMKEKMKSAFNNQVAAMRKEQEAATVRLEQKLEKQCHSHAEELKKYNRHISELSTQLWDVGEKLIIERQNNDELQRKLKEFKLKFENMELQNARRESIRRETIRRESEIFHELRKDKENVLPPIDSSIHKMQSVRGFQIMGNAFRTEDEEGEVFDTTYNLADMQKPHNSSICSGSDVDRLSILQLRNAKCRPHLKSSYPAEMAFNPVPVSEDEIKTGQPEEVFNDSLSQSLLTGKKVKRSNRTRTGGSETPRRSRRFSNIFRKPRLSVDRNKLP